MPMFQNTVLMVAIVIFIFIMVLIAVVMKESTSTLTFPPQVGGCPDFWQKLLDGRCQNVQGLGSNCASPMDFNTQNLTIKELTDNGYEEEVVNEVYAKIIKNEYKRRQAPIGIRISNKAFGMGRRFPIVNQYREKNK